ncbi:MAG: hypothetical protein CL764_01925 [Chloroflexi bacterium]|nr:hypothetical protein [Chloroflexota bacterium]|tara:strand:+ start:443 stop:1090 length:648 start_codon:yes stop_codon:yes gene_type:complete
MSVNNLRQRIISAYPDWDKWTKLQKQLLLLRSAHGEYWQKDPTDSLSNILITDQYEKLSMVAKIFNVKKNEINKAITSSTSFMKALQDYAKSQCYRYGKTKRGKKMKRRCTSKDLLELLCYENVPSAIFSVISGSRYELIGVEQESDKLSSQSFGTYRMKTDEEIFLDEHNYLHYLIHEKSSIFKGNIHKFINSDLLPNFDVKHDIHYFEKKAKG